MKDFHKILDKIYHHLCQVNTESAHVHLAKEVIDKALLRTPGSFTDAVLEHRKWLLSLNKRETTKLSDTYLWKTLKKLEKETTMKIKDEILEKVKDILHKHITDPNMGTGNLIEALMSIRDLLESEIKVGDVVMNTAGNLLCFFICDGLGADGPNYFSKDIGGLFNKEDSKKCPPEIEPQIRALL